MPLIHIVLIQVKESIIKDEAAFATFKKEMQSLEELAITKKVVKELKFGPPAFPARAQGGWQPLIPYSRELTDTISSGCRYELRPLLRL